VCSDNIDTQIRLKSNPDMSHRRFPKDLGSVNVSIHTTVNNLKFHPRRIPYCPYVLHAQFADPVPRTNFRYSLLETLVRHR
jgi:hypothetical protein